MSDLLKVIDELRFDDVMNEDQDATASEVASAVCDLLSDIILRDEGEDAKLKDWEEAIREQRCAVIGEHDWAFDQCGYWGHQYCAACHKSKHPELARLRVSEAVKLTGNASEEEYDKLFGHVMGIFDAKKSQSMSIQVRIEAADALGRAGDPRFSPRDRRDNWVTIPTGKFRVKSTGNEVELDEFRIVRYPVTVLEYAEFVQDGGYHDERWWSAGGFGKWTQPKNWDEQLETPTRPVIYVSWFEASAFAAWFSSHLPADTTCRLLTEAEWERAAGGTEGREFPWGLEAPDETRLNYAPDFKPNVGHVTPVGLYPRGATPNGIHDMAGNVWEWCVDWYHEKPPGGRNPVATDEVPRRETGRRRRKSSCRVSRGGGWSDPAEGCRVARRSGYGPELRVSGLGFRVAAVQSG